LFHGTGTGQEMYDMQNIIISEAYPGILDKRSPKGNLYLILEKSLNDMTSLGSLQQCIDKILILDLLIQAIFWQRLFFLV